MTSAHRSTILLAVAALASCKGKTGLSIRPEPERQGRQTYLRACASCHGETGRGDGPVATTFVRPVPDLTTLATRHGGVFPRDYVVGVIEGHDGVGAHGSREMPVWGAGFDSAPGVPVAMIYTWQRVELIASYIESTQRTE